MKRIRRVLAVGAVNLLVLVALAVPVELIFGDWLGGGELAMLNVRPNTLDVEASPLYPPGTKITFSRDKYGFRAGAGEPSRIDVLAIGGSTTNERLLDDADLWTARLQRALAERGCALTIANAGVDGYSTVGHIVSFSRWFDRVPGLHPRHVLVYVGINDALLSPGQENPGDSQQFKSRWRRLEHYVAAHSALRRVYVTIRGWWAARRGGVLRGELPINPETAWEPTQLPPGFAAAAAAKAAVYRRRLERLDGLVRQFGATPIYITQARVDGRIVDGEWRQIVGSHGAEDTADLLAINQATLGFCRDTGETCVDLAGEIRFAPGDFYDAVHNTLAGSERIARFLAPALVPILCRPPLDK